MLTPRLAFRPGGLQLRRFGAPLPMNLLCRARTWEETGNRATFAYIFNKNEIGKLSFSK
jgi:hypothetical protein